MLPSAQWKFPRWPATQTLLGPRCYLWSTLAGVCLLLIAQVSGCTEDLCRGQAPAFQLDLTMGSGVDVTEVKKVKVWASVGNTQREDVFDVAGLLDDGRTSISVEVKGEEASAGFETTVQAAALDKYNLPMVQARQTFSGTGDACNFFQMTLAREGPADAGPPDTDSDMSSTCSPMADNGIFLNAGCDPDVQDRGVDAVFGFLQDDVRMWLIGSGNKIWLLNLDANMFMGEPQLQEQYFLAYPPGCGVMSPSVDEMPLNPGCNAVVKEQGVDAVGHTMFSDIGERGISLDLISGVRFWNLDPSDPVLSKGFIDARPKLSDEFIKYEPGVEVMDSQPETVGEHYRNPGFDPGVIQGGIDAYAEFRRPDLSSLHIITKGRRFWHFDTGAGTTGKGAFVETVGDLATHYRSFSPQACSTVIADGTPLNPGCDPDVQAEGVTALDGVARDGQMVYWQVISGKKYWNWDVAANGGEGAFVSGGKDIAELYRRASP